MAVDYFPQFRQLLANWNVWQAKPQELRSVCPLHAGASNRSSFRATRDGRWQCFSCGANGRVEDLLARMLGISRRQAQELVGSLPQAVTRLEEIPELPPFRERGIKPQKLLSEAVIGPYRRYCPNYLLARGFSETVLRRYEVGYDTQNCRIVIPARNVEGKLVGITYRRDFDTNDYTPKYWHEYWDKSQHLYGLHLVARQPHRRVFLVEGQLDVMRMHQLGLPAAAIMGSSLSFTQRALLAKHVECEKLVLMFDNDDAGKQATERAIKLLLRSSLAPRVYVAHYDGKDPGELTEKSKIRATPWGQNLLPDAKPRACFFLSARYNLAH